MARLKLSLLYLDNLDRLKKLKWDIDFADLEIKGRASKGNIVTKYSVKKLNLKKKGCQL